MTDSIDRALQMLGKAELPEGAVNFEIAVMARIDTAVRAREARPSLGVGLGAAVVAMTIGLASVNAVPAARDVPLELSVFSANAAFAPSTLLATGG
jgi:hypothetical protein